MRDTPAGRAAVHQALSNVLHDAMQQRPLHRDVVATATGNELAWVLHERAAMLTEVNRLRHIMDRPPVDGTVIEHAENRAAGHVDYGAQFTGNCARIVFDDDPCPAVTP